VLTYRCILKYYRGPAFPESALRWPAVLLVGIMASIWNYRGLIKKLAVTDLKVRYKNSALGLFWSLLQPLLMYLVLYVVFTSLMSGSTIEHYPLYLFLGIITWGFFDKATGFSLNSIVGKPSLIKKIYFPREVLVISACLTALMMSCMEFAVFAIFMLAFGVLPTAVALLFPLVLLIEFVFALGIALAIASLNVRFRDVQWMWAVVMQAGFFATPIMYSVSIFQNSTHLKLLAYNPMGLIIDMMRNMLIYQQWPATTGLIFTGAVAALCLALGSLVFRKLEPSFAEEV
jgi:lipopolysaccharide transport system permease protein